jgi:predicted site-specific integrase-resolvase
VADYSFQLSKKLNVSLRTLQEWRDTGLIPFIQIKGKIIYRQSDIDKLLQKHYFESWKE